MTEPNEGMTRRLEQLEAKVRSLESALVGQADWLRDLQSMTQTTLPGLADGLASNTRWLTDLERWVSSCVKTLASLGSQPLDSSDPAESGTVDVTATLMAHLQVMVVMDWIRHAEVVPEGPTVSVSMATRNRPEMAVAAARSVLAQSYGRLELLVVDDSDGEETSQALASLGDPRLRVVRLGDHNGAGAAFNRGLVEVAGDIVAFLDDDNLMHRDWLRSLAWAFTAFPDVGSVYGARVVDDPGARHAERSGMLPTLEFARYDRERHERANYVDRNTIAFRSQYTDVRYDESLRAAFDWDHSLRLFGLTEPLALPAIACYYRTLVPDRMSDVSEQRESVRRVRSRAHLSRPLRVLVHTAMYPVISETYIGEDIESLRQAGAEVEVSATAEAVSRSAGEPMPLLDVDAAIEDMEPDVVLMHWATHAEGELAKMESHRQPFVCRVHSFDVDFDRVKSLLEHPLCAGVFAHPHHLSQLPPGVQPLIPMVGAKVVIPPASTERDTLLSVSAGLPKKNFPRLVEAMAQLPDLHREIIVGRTNGLEDLPDRLQDLVAEVDPSIRVRVNVPRQEVLERLAASVALVYTLDPDATMGYPMSVIEAMLCGTMVIAPDRDEARTIVGPHLLTYRTSDDIVRNVREIAALGASLEPAREELRQRAAKHRDPAALRQLHDALQASLTRWRYEHG